MNRWRTYAKIEMNEIIVSAGEKKQTNKPGSRPHFGFYPGAYKAMHASLGGGGGGGRGGRGGGNQGRTETPMAGDWLSLYKRHRPHSKMAADL